jgi:NADH pyrophosphatase NudC (nudix superfamily)
MENTSFEKVLIFCPKCGEDGLRLNSEKGLLCSSCGFEFFFNAAAAVAALITDRRDRLLMAVRKHDPCKGMLDLPGGFVNHDESAEDALRRELLEELGVEIVNPEYFASFPNSYIYSGLCYKTLDMAFTADIPDMDAVKPSDDVEKVVFMDKDSVDYNAVAFDSIKKIIYAFMMKK